jgi:hypothetical protein
LQDAIYGITRIYFWEKTCPLFGVFTIAFEDKKGHAVDMSFAKV